MVVFIQSRNLEIYKKLILKLVNSMKADFLFAGLNRNRTFKKKKCQ